MENTADMIKQGDEIYFYRDKKLCIAEASLCDSCGKIYPINEVTVVSGRIPRHLKKINDVSSLAWDLFPDDETGECLCEVCKE